jgi:hypothetical protein
MKSAIIDETFSKEIDEAIAEGGARFFSLIYLMSGSKNVSTHFPPTVDQL